jgi:hypothetical protein
MSSATTPPALPRAAARLLLLCAVQVLGVYAWHALTRGAAAPFSTDDILGAFGVVWMVPALWLAAWQLTGLRDLRRALLGAAATLAMCVATFFAALVLGLFSAGLLALPTGAAGVVLIALFVARQEAAEDDMPRPAWPHVVGLLLALAGLIPAWLGTFERFHAEIPPAGASFGGLAAALLPYVLIFLPHGLLALAVRPGPAPLPWRRGGTMLAAGLLAPAAFQGPAWMATLPGRIAAEHAELRLFVEAGGRQSGLHPGAQVEAAMGGRRILFTVPEGWLGLHPGRPVAPELPRAIEIAPDPRLPLPAPPLRRLRLAAAIELPMVAVGAAGPEHAAWHPHGCTAPDAAGLVLCRQLAFRDDRVADAEVAARLPEAALPRRILARFETGESGWLMLAPGLQGRCYAREACRLRFAAEDGIEVEAEVPAAAGDDWPAVRAAVAALLRQAAGLELAPR